MLSAHAPHLARSRTAGGERARPAPPHSLILVSGTRVYRAQSSPLKGWGACRASGPTWGSSPRRLRRAVRLCLKTLQLAGGRRAVLCETHPPLPSVLLPLCHTCAQPYPGARPSRNTARAHALRLDRWPSVNIPMPMRFDLMVTPPTASWDPIPGRLFQPPARRPVRRCVGCTSKHHRISGWASKRRVGQSKKKTRGQPPQRPKTNCPTLQRAALPRPAPQRAPAGASRRRRETKARARGSQSNCRHNRPWGSVANWVALHSRRKPPQARASNTA